jgi:hypothetical protein
VGLWSSRYVCHANWVLSVQSDKLYDRTHALWVEKSLSPQPHKTRANQIPICTVCIRCSGQGFHQIYCRIRCIYSSGPPNTRRVLHRTWLKAAHYHLGTFVIRSHTCDVMLSCSSWRPFSLWDVISVKWLKAILVTETSFWLWGASSVRWLGLAKTLYIYTRCMYGMFGRNITKYTVIRYGVHIRFCQPYNWLNSGSRGVTVCHSVRLIFHCCFLLCQYSKTAVAYFHTSERFITAGRMIWDLKMSRSCLTLLQ